VKHSDRNVLRERGHQINRPVLWDQVTLTRSRDGSRGKYRAPWARFSLNVTADGGVIGAWLAMHEAVTTSRAYRKEAERFLFLANHERRHDLSLNISDQSLH
jgi:hypothetical protein